MHARKLFGSSQADPRIRSDICFDSRSLQRNTSELPFARFRWKDAKYFCIATPDLSLNSSTKSEHGQTSVLRNHRGGFLQICEMGTSQTSTQ